MAGKDASGAAWQFGRSPLHRKLQVAASVWTLLGVACNAWWSASADEKNAVRPASATAPVGASKTTPSAAGQQSSIVAAVNGEPITRQTLAAECLRRYVDDVLESMINKQIILQACGTRGITITQKDIEDEIQHVASKFSLSVDRWLSLLESERNVDPQQYRRDIIWPTLALRRLASDRATVTTEELRKAFESEYGPKVKALLIAVSSREKAEALLQKARAAPESFGQLAKEHSEDRATASAYGVIPPIRKHMGDPNLEQVAFSLKPGEVSPVVQVGNQYLVLKCEKHIDQVLIPSQQLAQVEQLLRERILEHKTRADSANLFQQLQSQAQIVNVYKNPDLQRQYPGVAALVNGQQITIAQLSDECIARYGTEVLEGEINRLLLLQELRRCRKTVEQDDIGREITRAADAYNYLKPDGTPDVQAWLKAVTEGDGTTEELYVRDAVWPSVALKKLVGESVQVTEEDLQKGFESNFGERVEVLAILLTNQRQAQEVWEMARNRPTDNAFGELANQYSVEPTSRANFGRVPPLRRHSGQPVLEKEAFRLKPGELSGILVLGDKYVILRCLGRTEPVVKEFATVKDELYKDIHEKKLRVAMAKEFDRLKETGKVDNFLAARPQTARVLGAKTASSPNPARR